MQRRSCRCFVNRKSNLWNLHSLSETYGQRPSAFLGLAPESWEAYQLDLATLHVGRWVENKLGERRKDGRPLHTLEELLDERPATTKAYASLKQAAPTGIRKMAIPENGIW